MHYNFWTIRHPDTSRRQGHFRARHQRLGMWAQQGPQMARTDQAGTSLTPPDTPRSSIRTVTYVDRGRVKNGQRRATVSEPVFRSGGIRSVHLDDIITFKFLRSHDDV
ncbi:hypothetical protein O3P69_020007 [Scylla paramamosain]|uniref:Uncharacterized protein n=1 Tax=Scylla paramamosain TaxID=85552 RepID=A0AAW0TJA3_SCYPA